MKISRLNNAPKLDSLYAGGETDRHYNKRITSIVEDNYDFDGNNATDVSSIEEWDNMFECKQVDYETYRNAVNVLLTATTFSSLSITNKLIVSKLFLVDKTDRDTVMSDIEQELAKTVYSENFLDVIHKLASDNLENEITTGPAPEQEVAFDKYVQYTEGELQSSTSDDDFQDKVSITTANLETGEYLINWYCETQNTAGNGRTEIQVLIGNTIIGATGIESEDKKDWLPQTGFKKQTVSGVNTIKLQYRRKDGGTSKIRRTRLKIIRLA